MPLRCVRHPSRRWLRQGVWPPGNAGERARAAACRREGPEVCQGNAKHPSGSDGDDADLGLAPVGWAVVADTASSWWSLGVGGFRRVGRAWRGLWVTRCLRTAATDTRRLLLLERHRVFSTEVEGPTEVHAVVFACSSSGSRRSCARRCRGCARTRRGERRRWAECRPPRAVRAGLHHGGAGRPVRCARQSQKFPGHLVFDVQHVPITVDEDRAAGHVGGEGLAAGGSSRACEHGEQHRQGGRARPGGGRGKPR